MKIKIMVFISIMLGIEAVSAQTKPVHFIHLQWVNIPDSISKKLEDAYDVKDANAGKDVYNLLYKNNRNFKDGIFSFQGTGADMPRRVFIYNKKKLYIFNYIGAFDPIEFMKEYIDCIPNLNLSNKQAILYLKAVAEYLYEEYGNTYGVDFKLDEKQK